MGNNINNDDAIVLNKIIDKEKIASIRQIEMYTDFLNIHEQSIYKSNKKYLAGINHIFYGGYDYSERKILAFYPDYIDSNNIKYPIVILEIRPRNMKFSNNLTHRDFLGAILNLGITRAKVGDIIVKDNFAIAFVSQVVSDYIITSLEKVKQTVVDVQILHTLPDEILTPSFQHIKGTVSSIRLDSLISLAFPLSRGKAVTQIRNKNVYVNSKMILSPSYNLIEGDIVSVRGIGKFLFYQIGNRTKKDRIYIELKRYT
ncbi:RNA-binding cell division protein [Vallitalea longa]|uniref:RNA-binding cell division protein n=1 Tax=Vallitalea longa TaxID=2936439 RepID=A0A9W5YAG4_9FIRM|nr:YlmH/Sll1252 family protein [Vallitalea longa]GKX28793.1 RNA-binding cell division protein [Vallitalea longa]